MARSSIGSATRRSMATNAPSAATQTASAPSVCPEPQPSSATRTRAKVSAAAARVKAPPPAQSIRGRCGRRDSLSVRRAMTIVARPIGTLTKKIQRQERPWVSRPPMIGPAATAAPEVAPQMPKAVPRSRPW